MNVEVCRDMHRIDFNSINDFYRYIIDTPLNESFRFESLSSSKQNNSKGWSGTDTFEEACDLLNNGWTHMSEKLKNTISVKGKFEQQMVSSNVQSVQGFHPVVPLYLMGVPNNMIGRQIKPMRQKVITLDKSFCYSADIPAYEIEKESVKALRLIQKLESQNYRVKLNVIIGVAAPSYGYEKYFIRIKVKDANERLNISKLSFPLVHPSMLRRLYFRFMEVYPPVSKRFVGGYGVPQSPFILRSVWPDDIILPQFIRKDIEKINSLDDLENL